AAQLVKMGDWDLVVSDVNLPGLDGIELVRHFKSDAPQLPVLLMTAHESVDCVIRALQNRADDFLVKPFTRETLTEKARSLIRKAALQRAQNRRQHKIVLAIGAHPDDVEIACGGMLLRHREKGDAVVILTLSDGQEGGDQERRRKESEKAATQLGARLFWGGLRDTQISDGLPTIKVIEDVIRQIGPDIIYTHSQNDSHQDHRNTFLATTVAARRVPNLYCYQSPSTTIGFQPNRFVEISEQMSEKLKLISLYETQTSKCAYLEADLIRSTARYWGRFAGNKLVEPLEIIKENQ
ncbi:MAG TPA: PIG-L family deacetylase, partial [Blastocatellia bacterium]|nr:PIG-L family deacetylase [Blastocatellia bacterium]